MEGLSENWTEFSYSAGLVLSAKFMVNRVKWNRKNMSPYHRGVEGDGGNGNGKDLHINDSLDDLQLKLLQKME